MPSIVAITDLHAGSIYSAVNPETRLQTGDGKVWTPEERSETAEWSWNVLTQIASAACDIQQGFRLVVLGDVCHGNKHLGEVISDNIAHQPEIAVWTLLPFLSIPNLEGVEFIIGTAAHNAGQGALEILVARIIQAAYPNLEVNISYHKTLYTENGTKPWADLAHHGPHPGMYLHTSGNVARIHTRNYMLLDILQGIQPPKYILRGHFHQKNDVIVDVGDYRSQLLLLPSLSGAGEYARKSGRSPQFVTVGGVVIENDTVTWIKDTKDIRQRTILE